MILQLQSVLRVLYWRRFRSIVFSTHPVGARELIAMKMYSVVVRTGFFLPTSNEPANVCCLENAKADEPISAPPSLSHLDAFKAQVLVSIIVMVVVVDEGARMATQSS